MTGWAEGLQRRLAGRPRRDRVASNVKASATEAGDGYCPEEVDAVVGDGSYRCQVRAGVPHDEHECDGMRWRKFEGQEAVNAALDMLARCSAFPSGEVPEAGPVRGEGGWLAGEPEDLMTAPDGSGDLVTVTDSVDIGPGTTWTEVPAEAPGDVLGFVVVLPGRVLSASATAGGTVGWLANADLMSLEHAEHEADVTRGTLCEVRAVKR